MTMRSELLLKEATLSIFMKLYVSLKQLELKISLRHKFCLMLILLV